MMAIIRGLKMVKGVDRNVRSLEEREGNTSQEEALDLSQLAKNA